MKKTCLKQAVCSLLALILVLVLMTGNALKTRAAESSDGWTWTRLAGATRFATMAKITSEAYPSYEAGTLNTLIVATGESFPDALSGAALAGLYNCPIILTQTKSLSPQARSEILRLADPDGCNVIILGGTGAVSQATENAIKGLGVSVERIAGKTRLETALKVFAKGKKLGSDSWGYDTVIITTGYNYADALSISPYAYASQTPIFLTNSEGVLDAKTKQTLSESADFERAIIVGGTLAVAKETETYLNSIGMDVMRLNGSSRYHTSAQIIRWELGLLDDALFQPSVEMTSEGMGIATGENFADALASVSLLGKTNSVLMLVSSAKNRSVIQANFDELIKPYAKEMGKGYIFGGLNAVSQEIEDLLNECVQIHEDTPFSFIITNEFPCTMTHSKSYGYGVVTVNSANVEITKQSTRYKVKIKGTYKCEYGDSCCRCIVRDEEGIIVVNETLFYDATTVAGETYAYTKTLSLDEGHYTLTISDDK
ncbi:MAG: cell wall-binding repeat-containing protein [Lachnospiraceae bacterium]|nr:cell wall-binding repeat-containing protein [Lachnospiraceae bacterium]